MRRFLQTWSISFLRKFSVLQACPKFRPEDGQSQMWLGTRRACLFAWGKTVRRLIWFKATLYHLLAEQCRTQYHYSMAPSFLSFESWLKCSILAEIFPSPQSHFLCLLFVSFTGEITPGNCLCFGLLLSLRLPLPKGLQAPKGSLLLPVSHQHWAQCPAHSKCSTNVPSQHNQTIRHSQSSSISSVPRESSKVTAHSCSP